jgi:hypothetical protein
MANQVVILAKVSWRLIIDTTSVKLTEFNMDSAFSPVKLAANEDSDPRQSKINPEIWLMYRGCNIDRI